MHYYWILSFIVALAVSYFTQPLLRKYAQKWGLLDIPGGRKIHENETSSTGGVGVFLGMMMACVVSGFGIFKIEMLMPILLLFIMGVLDDIKPIPAFKKLKFQVIAVAIFLYLYPYPISFGNLLLLGFFLLALLNAYNFIDGIHGLAGLLAMVYLLVFTLIFWPYKDILLPLLALAGGILGFLPYNIRKGRILLGDSGTMLIAFSIGIFSSILFSHSWVSQDLPHITFLILIFFMPLFDLFRVMFIRFFIVRTSPFQADNRHLHHLLLRYGYSHSFAALSITAYQLLLLVLTFIFRRFDWSLEALLLAAVFITTLLSYLLWLQVKRKESVYREH